jgi:hypothetical protein
MRRGRGGRAIEELPDLSFEAEGINIRNFGGWRLLKQGDGTHVIKSVLRLVGWVNANDYEIRDETSWRLTISQPQNHWGRRGQGRVAMIYPPKASDNQEAGAVVFRFTASNWTDAITALKYHAGDRIVKAMRSFGAELYSREGAGWEAFRPFVVVYPYKDPKEPNAKYSPFKLCQGLLFDAETDGVTSYVFKLASINTHAEAHKCGANAFLRGPDDQGRYWVHHRDMMRAADEIDIDEWRGRIIAGAGENF